MFHEITFTIIDTLEIVEIETSQLEIVWASRPVFFNFKI